MTAPPTFSWGDRLPFLCSELDVEGEIFSLWHAGDMDPFLDELLARDAGDIDLVDERLPYWAELWPSALGLARAIAREASFFQNLDVCELGCGPGLAGLAAARAGARVLWTDYQERALELAAVNARANHIKNPSTALLDWRHPPTDQKFDLLLASDVAYEARAFEPLMQCFQHMLRPEGSVWLTEPLRPVARPFVARLKAEGYRLEDALQALTWKDRTVEVLLWKIRLPGA